MESLLDAIAQRLWSAPAGGVVMRREVMPQVRRIVVKVGSRVLTDDQGDLDYAGYSPDQH
ncbi:MAG: hypothetical protein MZW92_37635 [Comamonadaceae bacterium]|nr:hypothetical protein [Comamonadaceae bacterium]